ncbi:MAG: DNA polymerase III subunit epsilon [Alphaproteobacteria bacterium]|nr:DNA polymerase III subunit epsilon [Alphaproteobacteria bacterium]MBQ6854674.1 DNA polymerase III subunit epsilon [Alphaproteobacteria bacterium]
MREIVFDTETTGLDPFQGDRVVEIGCVELINHVPTGRTYHQYINPERSLSEEVVAVHGLTEQFLSDKPKFSEIVDEFLAFIGSDSMLVAHNASFDMKFLNAELSWVGYPPLSYDRVIDTLILARKKFPGSRVNLNELCKRFHIDNSARTVHGALLDSELLADVYLELLGGREPGLILDKKIPVQTIENKSVQIASVQTLQREYREPRVFGVVQDEIEQHIDFVRKIKNNLWGVE